MREVSCLILRTPRGTRRRGDGMKLRETKWEGSELQITSQLREGNYGRTGTNREHVDEPSARLRDFHA